MKQTFLLLTLILTTSLAFSQENANNYVTVIRNMANPLQSTFTFTDQIMGTTTTVTVEQLRQFARTVEPEIDAQIVSATKVNRFTQMQEVYNDQKARIDHLGQRQNNIRKLLLQLGSIITQQQEELSTLAKWLEKSLYQEGSQSPPTVPVTGDTRTNPATGDYEYWNGSQWIILSEAKVTIEEEQ